MEYLLILIVVFGAIGLFTNGDKWDAQEKRARIRESIRKDAMFQIGRTWIVQGGRREWL